jgi:hypothetical protein
MTTLSKSPHLPHRLGSCAGLLLLSGTGPDWRTIADQVGQASISPVLEGLTDPSLSTPETIRRLEDLQSSGNWLFDL